MTDGFGQCLHDLTTEPFLWWPGVLDIVEHDSQGAMAGLVVHRSKNVVPSAAGDLLDLVEVMFLEAAPTLLVRPW